MTMKTIKMLALALIAMALGCKEEKAEEDTETQTVITEEKSHTTETGQRIGATKDSTSVDDEPGTPSNY